MKKLNRVRLTAEERADFWQGIAVGRHPFHYLPHARLLHKADEAEGGPTLCEDAVAATFEVSRSKVERTMRLFEEAGLAVVLAGRDPKLASLAKLDGEIEAHLVARTLKKPTRAVAECPVVYPAGRRR